MTLGQNRAVVMLVTEEDIHKLEFVTRMVPVVWGKDWLRINVAIDVVVVGK